MNRLLPLLALSLFTMGGCATYEPADLATLRPQDRVRVELAQDELARVVRFADTGRGTLDGRVLSYSEGSLTLAVATPATQSRVSVAEEGVLGVAKRRVSVGRSMALSSLLVGGVAVLAVIGFEGRDQVPGGDGGGPEAAIVSRLRSSFGLSIPFRLGG